MACLLQDATTYCNALGWPACLRAGGTAAYAASGEDSKHAHFTLMCIAHAS